MKEYKGIPMGQIWSPDPTVPTLTHKGIKVTSLKEIEAIMQETGGYDLTVDYTNLSDIDDTMDMDTARIGLIGLDAPSIPEGNEPSDNNILQTIRKSISTSGDYLKQLKESNNATKS